MTRFDFSFWELKLAATPAPYSPTHVGRLLLSVGLRGYQEGRATVPAPRRRAPLSTLPQPCPQLPFLAPGPLTQCDPLEAGLF